MSDIIFLFSFFVFEALLVRRFLVSWYWFVLYILPFEFGFIYTH